MTMTTNNNHAHNSRTFPNSQQSHTGRSSSNYFQHQNAHYHGHNSTTKTHHGSVSAVVVGSVLIIGALLLPLHGIIAAAFVLALAISGAYLIAKGINSMVDAKQPQQEMSYLSTF